MYYIRILENRFAFLIEGINVIFDTDIKITKEEYEKFFELQTLGKQFEIQNKNGKTLFDIIRMIGND